MDQFDLTIKLHVDQYHFVHVLREKEDEIVDREFYKRVKLLAKNINLPEGYYLNISFSQTTPMPTTNYIHSSVIVGVYMAHPIDGEPEQIGTVRVYHFNENDQITNVLRDGNRFADVDQYNFVVVEAKIREIIALAPDYSNEINPELIFSRRAFGY